MVVDRIEDGIRRQANAGAGALLPCFTAGFPDVETTAELIRAADASGASVVEVAVPFSDSIADGPVIRNSFDHALARGHSLQSTFEMIAGVRGSVICGLVVMISYSIVYRIGLAGFMDRAADAGLDGVILPDVPLEESAPVRSAVRNAGLCHIGLVAPTTSPARRKAIAETSSGFVYQIAALGTTGERAAVSGTLCDEVAELRGVSGLPVCVGFGISTAEHVREVCGFADGAIVGSALIHRIDEELKNGGNRSALVKSVSELLAELMSGTVLETP